ncbi:hypothetical protein [Entomospira culicis]|uniref:Uncharacterized protein n=1 Tax=Entomospira culicis TaxID=2719989 RepID=A0A968GJE5_9SPIO|nr:hypothetical protein [Entomospira culicis]NIZ19315.1 hypothetical protein [Entomospira culicis]NIZ69780.1 hypothetical protein [Entomospira culicis]WDI36891.1 hypothetical protein PVA46_06075 [Entomospira culicis]WDI38520.1 hypothetical protein PVA47_06085 [Entomospira culicis]
MSNITERTQGEDEFAIFWDYFKLRFTLYLKEESKLLLGLLLFVQLSYTISLLMQINMGATDIMNDASLFFLPFLWTFSASTIFAKERKASRSILTLTTPISGYHRFTIAVVLALFLIPGISVLLTRIIYLLNIGIAAILVPNKEGFDNAYSLLTLRQLWDQIQIPISPAFGWFLPVSIYFFAASVIRRYVFIKVILFLWLFSMVGIILLLFFTIANILNEQSMERFGEFFLRFGEFYLTRPLLFNLMGFAISFIFLTFAYFKVKTLRVA